MSQQKEMYGKIASLETEVDMLEAELNYLNRILTQCGFPEGIKTLKSTVLEVIEEDALHALTRGE